MQPTIEKAVEAHKSGQLVEAEALRKEKENFTKKKIN
jgi:hypothetical protein